jgi:hypothetical protein
MGHPKAFFGIKARPPAERVLLVLSAPLPGEERSRMPTWVFWLVTISVTLLGIGLISLATAFDFYGHQVTRELTRAFGEAFVVAAFIASTVDQYIKHGLVSDLYKYIAGYGLPSDIQDKIEELTKTTIIRRDFSQNYLLEHHSNGRLKLTVDGTYKIVNCSNHVKEHTPRLDFEKHEDPTLDYFRCDSADSSAVEVKKGNESLSEKQDGVLSVSLRKKKVQPEQKNISYSVSFRYSRIVDPKDSDILSFILPTIGIVVSVDRPNDISFDAGKATVETENRWEFTGLFLENQHIHVRWSPN